MTLTEHPNTLRSVEETFTPEEITKYATYHWRQTSDAAYHVWRTIGATYEYLGVMDATGKFSGDDEQLPLVPALDLTDVIAGGPTPSAGGTLPWQRSPKDSTA